MSGRWQLRALSLVLSLLLWALYHHGLASNKRKKARPARRAAAVQKAAPAQKAPAPVPAALP